MFNPSHLGLPIKVFVPKLKYMNAHIKLTEVWKAINTENNPLNIALPTLDPNDRNSRSSSNGRLKLCNGKSLSSQSTFLNDGKRVWNNAPIQIRECNSIYSVNKEIKKFVSTLPL